MCAFKLNTKTQSYGIGDGIAFTNNSANYLVCASWNDINGNITSVGTNGGPSYYNTYDQSGLVYEWNDLDNTSSLYRGFRGWGFNPDGTPTTNPIGLSKTGRGIAIATFTSLNGSFRVCSVSNPLSLNNFVDIINSNNSVDTTGYGSVGYNYKIGKYIITVSEYIQFLNSIASTDTHGIYSADMTTTVRPSVLRTGSSGSYSYSLSNPNMGNKPITSVSWFNAARYCNWLHNNKPNGSQNSSTTEDGAYTLNNAMSGSVPVKNNNANYYIPSENEWYKAAYYDPTKSSGNYWLYATRSNIAPLCVNAKNISGTDNNYRVYRDNSGNFNIKYIV